MLTEKKYFFLFNICVWLSLGLPAITQERSLQIGGKLINEFTFYNGFAPGFGGQVVYRIGKHGGLESGLNYQNKYLEFFTFVQVSGSSYTYYIKIAEHHLQIPLLYRFDSKAINFSAGPVIDYFIGWDIRQKDPGVTVNDYDRNTISLIGAAGISRSFYLSSTIILEPELKLNYIFTEDDGGLAINIVLRKKLF
jgi:hypothetical protein